MCLEKGICQCIGGSTGSRCSSIFLSLICFSVILHQLTFLVLYYDSLILSSSENSYLLSITNPTKRPALLYRATRDGFTRSGFYANCEGQRNTVSIYKTNYNHVFGAYTAVPWSNSTDRSYVEDRTAFIFSLRRNQFSQPGQKFMINEPDKAIFRHSSFIQAFGSYVSEKNCDIRTTENSNTNNVSLTDFGGSFNLPVGYSKGQDNTKSYLPGAVNWLTTEIEVFQI